MLMDRLDRQPDAYIAPVGLSKCDNIITNIICLVTNLYSTKHDNAYVYLGGYTLQPLYNNFAGILSQTRMLNTYKNV